MMNLNERTYTLLYKNISLTLYSRKGDVSCVWGMSWRRGRTVIWPKVLLSTIVALLPHLGWVAQPWVTEGSKPSFCCWLSIRHLVPNWLRPSVCLVLLLFNTHLLPLFFRLLTLVHLLIDGSVEGQYVTIVPFLFFKIPHVEFFLHVLLHPPHTHILQIILRDHNSKNTKGNYLNNSKKKNLN